MTAAALGITAHKQYLNVPDRAPAKVNARLLLQLPYTTPHTMYRVDWRAWLPVA